MITPFTDEDMEAPGSQVTLSTGGSLPKGLLIPGLL
jgi:hypothetical protein